MATQFSEPDHNFKAYYKDNSLLIQFMMVEFLQTYHLTLKIKNLIQERLNSNLSSDSFYPSLIQLLGELLGYNSQQQPVSCSPWIKGSLIKLKDYSEQLSRNSLFQNKNHFNLYMAVQKAWLTAINNFEILNTLYLNAYRSHTELMLSIAPLKRAFNTLQNRFNRVIRTIPRVMTKYWNNENVILCVFRKRAQFAEIYGCDFLNKEFKWPIKVKDLLAFLVHRYRERGFENLLPTFQHILNQEALNGLS